MSLLSALSCYDSDEDAATPKLQPLPAFNLRDSHSAPREQTSHPVNMPTTSSEDTRQITHTTPLVVKRASSERDIAPAAKRARVQGVTALVPPQLRSKPNVVTEDHRKR